MKFQTAVSSVQLRSVSDLTLFIIITLLTSTTQGSNKNINYNNHHRNYNEGEGRDGKSPSLQVSSDIDAHFGQLLDGDNQNPLLSEVERIVDSKDSISSRLRWATRENTVLNATDSHSHKRLAISLLTLLTTSSATITIRLTVTSSTTYSQTHLTTASTMATISVVPASATKLEEPSIRQLTVPIRIDCTWTAWVVNSSCSATCGPANRAEIRDCVNTLTGQRCDLLSCEAGNSTRIVPCLSSPPCPDISINSSTSNRDPNIIIQSYLLPESMYFFEETYHRIWISNKGYISFDTPYYSPTMIGSVFSMINNQAIAAPFWTDLVYIENQSRMTIKWFSSTNDTSNINNAMNFYYNIIEQAISSACPISSCPQRPPIARVVEINWEKLGYDLPSHNRAINISFSVYLINTYDYNNNLYSYPALRSYIVFDYKALTPEINNYFLRPFVGYRGKTSMIRILNDRLSYQNAYFLTQRENVTVYAGSRFLSQCEVDYLEEALINVLYPWKNLNDVVINPRLPCPCTLLQAQRDTRFGRLFSETLYEISEGIVCYAPQVTVTTWSGWTPKLLKAQTCCYRWSSLVLITSGSLAGSVLSNPYIIFQSLPSQRRIPFYDHCCSPNPVSKHPDWMTCRLYFQLHPPSSCTGYQPPAIVTGVGDPHIVTVDNNRYTCHIEGLFVFAQTTDLASATAQNNLNRPTSIDPIFPNDLFKIHVYSVFIPPVLSYIERNFGYGSIFSNYTIITERFTFVISNNNGKFGFSVNNNSSLTQYLTDNSNFDYISTNNYSFPFIYRVRQSAKAILNKTISQLTISLWSGLSMQFEIIGENLECTLVLPQKFRGHVEGLIGNFDGDPENDLIDRITHQTVSFNMSNYATNLAYDNATLRACLSWRIPGTKTTNVRKSPIMPRNLTEWYFGKNGSNLLANLNSGLNEISVNRTCHGSSFECIHDYIIRINSFTSEATATGLETFQESKISLSEIPPIDNLTLPIPVYLSVNDANRKYPLGIHITEGTKTRVTNVVANITNNENQKLNNSGPSTIIIPIPANKNSFVDILLIIQYGSNARLEKYLDIIACLCMNKEECNYEDVISISEHYQLASCTCPSQKDGTFCELDYNGCKSGGACKVNWDISTTCVNLSAQEQLALNTSYFCRGKCLSGYTQKNNFTCVDEDECLLNKCGPKGNCTNLEGSYTCTCEQGYRFDANNGSCVDIDECSQPYTNGSLLLCPEGHYCMNFDGGANCTCQETFYTNGICTFNSSQCTMNGTNTCMIGNTTLCLNGTMNINGTCRRWCDEKCPGFCKNMSDTHECDCAILPGYQRSPDGQTCLPCYNGNYGYGCNAPCRCVHGNCSLNATHVNESCICDVGYEIPFCNKLQDNCDNVCNKITEDCNINPNNGSVICDCKSGYEKNATVTSCTNINECATNTTHKCDSTSSICVDTVGSYRCDCKSGYENDTQGACTDINECLNKSSCLTYQNTDCVNTPGFYECRCISGYSVGGEKTREGENVLGTSNTCIKTNYSSDCVNQCKAPAYCTSGTCSCPIELMIKRPSNDSIRDTCVCPGDPFIIHNNTIERCVLSSTDVIEPTWILLRLNEVSKRECSSDEANLTSTISEALFNISKNCSGPCIRINTTTISNDNMCEYLGTMAILLDPGERLLLINRLIEGTNTKTTNKKIVEVLMVINNQTGKLMLFSEKQPPCKECEFMERGICIPNQNDTCYCNDTWLGPLCREKRLQPIIPSSASTYWTFLVGITNAIVGILLLIL